MHCMAPLYWFITNYESTPIPKIVIFLLSFREAACTIDDLMEIDPSNDTLGKEFASVLFQFCYFNDLIQVWCEREFVLQ